jgi:hypothetical protein
MGLVYSIVSALALWIVLWALGAKALDSFLVAALIMIVAVTVAMLAPFHPGKKRQKRPRPNALGRSPL